MPDPISVAISFGGTTYRGILQPDVVPPPHPPEPSRRTFSVYTGAAIPTNLRNIVDVSRAIKRLCPWTDIDRPNFEWWIKAGEGGSWEGEWDTHPLALGSEDDLVNRNAEAWASGLRLVPWVNLRGRPEWEEGEHQLIRDCAAITGAVALNLEPGEAFWNGPTTPSGVEEWLGRLGLAPELLWLVSIPRGTAGDALGGPEVMRTWLSRVAGASWENYALTSADLAPDLAIPRVIPWIPNGSPWHQIPIVQHDDIARWANTKWAQLALQVWTIDGN